MLDSDDFTMADFFESEDADLFAKAKPLREFIQDWKSKGTYTYRRPIKSKAGPVATVWCEHAQADKEMLMLASNNYLGLNHRPEVIEAACEAARKYGTSMCGAPFLNGTFDLLLQLEKKLAEFEQCEAAMVFTTGYQANVGAISALMRPHDVAIIDRLAHASVVDGCRLAGCEIHSFKHNNVKHLDMMLKKSAGKGGALVIVEGIFSMDGDRAPLPDIVAVVKKHGARIMVDEAHATGVIGPSGRGVVELFDLHGQVDLILGTFSKSLASTGGFVAGTDEVINYIRHYARSYIFSASPTPANVGAALKALEIIEREPQLREQLWRNVRYFHEELKKRGFQTIPDSPQSGIMAILIGKDSKLRPVSRAIHQAGVFLNPVVYPAVGKNASRLRISLSACHTRQELDRGLEVLTSVCKAHNII